MFRSLSLETLVKLAIALAFLMCYSWFYHTMVKDEVSLVKAYASRYEMLEKSTGDFLSEKPSDSD